MVPGPRSHLRVPLPFGVQTTDSGEDRIPTKQETLEDIRDGYLFVMSGGRGQPVDEMHREIAEELAREELGQDAEVGR